MIRHLLNRSLEVWRPQTSPDGQGGQTVTVTLVGSVAAKVDQPTAAEKEIGQAWAAEHTHTIYLTRSADVARGDELVGDGQRFRLLATLQPSRQTYTKAPASLMEHEGA
jgi:hypothetical protein